MPRLPVRMIGLAIVVPSVLSAPAADAQQPAGQTAPAGRAASLAGPPPGFQLNQLEQAYLDQALSAWEHESAKISTFTCGFDRWDFNAWKPAPDLPFSKERGSLSYQKPDKGSFQITKVKQWTSVPQTTGEQGPPQGDWQENPNAIGEHWVCDGASVYEYRHNQKQLVVTPIPEQLQGKSIVDGPLPFLFGAEAAKLKARYWMKIDPRSNDNEIWVAAIPKAQADAANFQGVILILDRQRLLPRAMQIVQPGGTHVDYIFDIANASINRPVDRLFNALFQSPTKPFGWQLVEEQMPVGGPPPQANRQALGEPQPATR